MEQQPNLDYIKDLSGDDIEFEQKFIAVLREEIPLEKQEYIRCITAENFKDTASIVHKLKHKLNILGLKEDYKLSVIYEEDLKKGDASLNDKFLFILNKIENYIKNL
ncbi:Hpt domain-containing protein [Cellulophaga sp. L1A9]|uniref:Hpt domain-containing protein n=1 Tax=Cellulophaga sp. L1A9 TaxID=2686362 RepID=UPI00131EA676|nr:Hpt domain-containing protein [Cellulophaga sp. L1A9]